MFAFIRMWIKFVCETRKIYKMKESKLKSFFRKAARELSLWTFRNIKVFHEFRRLSIDKKNPVLIRTCDCDHCRARKIRKQFSMTQEEGFDALVVSSKIIKMTEWKFFFISSYYPLSRIYWSNPFSDNVNIICKNRWYQIFENWTSWTKKSSIMHQMECPIQKVDVIHSNWYRDMTRPFLRILTLNE